MGGGVGGDELAAAVFADAASSVGGECAGFLCAAGVAGGEFWGGRLSGEGERSTRHV